MKDNPYRDELRDIVKERQKYLRLHFSTAIINMLTAEDEAFILNLSSSQLLQLRKLFQSHPCDALSLQHTIHDFQVKCTKLQPTQLRISTMTACSSVGCKINTAYLYECFVPPTDILSTDPSLKKKYKPEVQELVIGCKAEDYESKGFFEKEKNRIFFNSAALNLLIYDNKCINVKVFNNGKLQMTGVPSEEHGKRAVEIIVQLFGRFQILLSRLLRAIKHFFVLVSFGTVMINSDYYCGTEVKVKTCTKF